MLKQAAEHLRQLRSEGAAAQPEFADAVKRSKDRAQDIRDTVKFIEEGQTAAAIEAARQEKEQGAPSDDGRSACRRRSGRRAGSRRLRPRAPAQ